MFQVLTYPALSLVVAVHNENESNALEVAHRTAKYTNNIKGKTAKGKIRQTMNAKAE